MICILCTSHIVSFVYDTYVGAMAFWVAKGKEIGVAFEESYLYIIRPAPNYWVDV